MQCGERFAGRAAKPRVGLLLADIAELGAGGGAERFCAQVVAGYRARAGRQFDLRLITDPLSLQRLDDSGVVLDRGAVDLLPDVRGWTSALRRAHALRELTADLVLLHLPLISPRYLPYLWWWRHLRGDRLRLTLQVVDVNLARTYFALRECRDAEQLRSALLHRMYFRTVRIDGMYTWYRAWADAVARVPARGRPLVQAASCYFVDTERFRPATEKQRVIVFAGRLIDVKRPLLFVDAIAELVRRAPHLLEGWQVRMYGGGAMERKVREALMRRGLDGVIELSRHPDLAPVFARSRLFVSTHAGENFSSLALLEAMACGNAVVAQDAGQTREVIEHHGNGVLTTGDRPEDFARAIAEYLAHPEWHEPFARRSREITLTRHTATRFFDDLEAFWRRVLARPR